MGNRKQELPEIVEQSPEEYHRLLEKMRSREALTDTEHKIVVGCVEFARWMPEEIKRHRISLASLRRLLFGDSGRRRKKKPKLRSIQSGLTIRQLRD